MSVDTHRVHGLDADEVQPDWPALTLGEVDALLAQLSPARSAHAIIWNSPRPLSAAALVMTTSGVLFVKRHHQSIRSLATLQEEHAFAHWLHHRSIPTPSLCSNSHGQTASQIGSWVYEVYAPADGIDLHRDTMSWVPLTNLDHAHTAGAMLAQLHIAAEGYTAPQRSTHLLVARSELLEATDPIATLAAQLPLRPGLAQYLAQRDWQTELRALLQPHPASFREQFAAQPRLWTHGDWHASNLFWSSAAPNATITSVLDFSLSARTFALFDLATAIERSAIAWLAPEGQRAHADVARALIQGYCSKRPLGVETLSLLPALLPLVHLDFALSEVEYFYGVLQSKTNADVAWDIFLRGHAAWFQSDEGQTFLAAIRSCHH